MKARKPQSKGLLTKAQLEILKAFRGLPDANRFYLTGGTALAEFYLGHRRSFDLDLFTVEQGLIIPFSRMNEERFSQRGFSVKIIRRLESFAEFELGWEDEKVRVQLAFNSPYRLAPPVETPLVLVNDFQDLVVDKLLAFFGRAEPRDAADLYFILKSEDFWELTELAAKKDPGFDLYWLALALEKVRDFPDELERWPVEMLQPLSPPDGVDGGLPMLDGPSPAARLGPAQGARGDRGRQHPADRGTGGRDSASGSRGDLQAVEASRRGSQRGAGAGEGARWLAEGEKCLNWPTITEGSREAERRFGLEKTESGWLIKKGSAEGLETMSLID